MKIIHIYIIPVFLKLIYTRIIPGPPSIMPPGQVPYQQYPPGSPQSVPLPPRPPHPAYGYPQQQGYHPQAYPQYPPHPYYQPYQYPPHLGRPHYPPHGGPPPEGQQMPLGPEGHPPPGMYGPPPNEERQPPSSSGDEGSNPPTGDSSEKGLLKFYCLKIKNYSFLNLE